VQVQVQVQEQEQEQESKKRFSIFHFTFFIFHCLNLWRASHLSCPASGRQTQRRFNETEVFEMTWK
jgi:hypothetical protein